MNIKVIFLLFCFIIIFIVCSSCIPLNSRDVTNLKGEVAQLQIECKELKQNRVDLHAKIDSAVNSLESLNALVYELQNKISLKDFKPDLDNKANNIVLPSSVYQSAYSDYVSGNYELAYSGFQSFIEKYPNAELAPQAQFYLGECFYSRKMWSNAIKEYEKVEGRLHSKSNLAASVHLKIALCYENLGMRREALKLFSLIVYNFPKSPEFLTAKEKIKIYTNAENK
ncbi:MAG: tetratricopeptide repeat protein [Endomicrobium sp.]|jgi:tol-pal system protein YbgF|nr:tetratricopeptide repeat protein [Endomicrobium sp.]